MPKYQILWIDDGAIIDLSALAGPVIASGKYNLVIATNVSDAIARMRQRKFDVVIVDVRLPPGELSEWIEIYAASGQNRAHAELGLEFLSMCFGTHPTLKREVYEGLSWIDEKLDRFGLFTVEERDRISGHVAFRHANKYCRKSADPSRKALINLIEQILKNG